MIKIIFSMMCLTLLFSCGTKVPTKKTSDEITTQDVDRAVTKFPEVTYDDLVKGQTMYKEHCGNCHGLKKASYTNEAGWRKVVPRMSAKVNRKAGTTLLGAKEQEQIIRYLVTMGEK